MNTLMPNPLIDPLPGVLQRLGLGMDAGEWLPGTDAALLACHATLHRGPWQQRYAFAPLAQATAPALHAALAQLRAHTERTGEPTLLVAEHLTAARADKLRAAGQAFIDLAGNAYLEAEGLLVYVTGQQPLATPDRPAARAFARSTMDAKLAATGFTYTTANIKLTFAALCQPELMRVPLRELAQAAGVALGTVANWLRALEAHQMAYEIQGRRVLQLNRGLLDEWALAYARRLRPKTLAGLYQADLQRWQAWPLDSPAPGAAPLRWGGEPGGALLTDYLRPGVLTLYGERLPPRLIVEQRLRRIERPVAPLQESGTLEHRKPFWGPALDAALPRPDVVHPILVYADLMATGEGRCRETARLLYETQLARLFEQP